MKKRLLWLVPAIFVIAAICLPLSFSCATAMNSSPEEDEEEISLSQVPDQVKEIILKEAGGYKIEEVEVATKHGVKIYEAEWIVGDNEVEIEVVYVCKLIRKVIEPAEDEDDEDGDDDDDEITELHEEEIDIDEVPAIVKNAIMKEAGSSKIQEVEKIATNKGTYFEAEWVAEGWEVEILLTAEGKLVRKEMEIIHGDDDDDDDDDDDNDDEDDDD
ncbi:MAG: hypothetical protein ACYTG7_15125 [Planctomycetota bacterium]|jgi:hypothetical protein